MVRIGGGGDLIFNKFALHFEFAGMQLVSFSFFFYPCHSFIYSLCIVLSHYLGSGLFGLSILTFCWPIHFVPVL